MLQDRTLRQEGINPNKIVHEPKKIAEGLPSASGQATTFKVPCSALRTTEVARLPDLIEI